jgi:hypothetical protein
MNAVMNATLSLGPHAAAGGPALAAVAALSKSSIKHSLDTGLVVAGLVFVGVCSLRAKRKEHGE